MTTKNKKRYFTLSEYLKQKFGGRVSKVTYKIGLTCPNRINGNGCIFCSGNELVPPWFKPGDDVKTQIEKGIKHLSRRNRPIGFIAYLQDHTGTYCSPELLYKTLRDASSVEGVVGLSIGTRPDCLDKEILHVLEHFNKNHPLWLELGLQSSSDRTLELIKRGHTAQDFFLSARLAEKAGLNVVAHVMVGLPGETETDVINTARFLADTGVQGVKVHNVIVFRGTELEKSCDSGLYKPFTLEEYSSAAASFLEYTPRFVVIHRLAADAPPGLIAGPGWAKNKSNATDAVDRELEKRNSCQGDKTQLEIVTPR